jgi:hypothetical protein
MQLATITQFATPVPKITTIQYSSGTAFSVAGGQTVTVNGTVFNTGIIATISNVATPVSFTGAVSPLTRINDKQLTFTSPAKPAGTYLLFLINTDGGWSSKQITYA